MTVCDFTLTPPLSGQTVTFVRFGNYKTQSNKIKKESCRIDIGLNTIANKNDIDFYLSVRTIARWLRGISYVLPPALLPGKIFHLEVSLKIP